MFKWFTSDEINESLSGLRRQYFAGDLDNPQLLDALETKDLEIGLTSYLDYHPEPPHYHTQAIEYQYVISGMTQYMDIDTKEVFEFKAGDFYAIYPETTYAQKSKPGTKILFIKVPSVRDKNLVDADRFVSEWLSSKLRSVRTDYYHVDGSPSANSIHPAAAVAIVKNGCLLLVKRGDSGNWTLPGGTLDFGESMTDCAIRELREETGMRVNLVDIIGTYTDPEIKIAYSDGEVRQEFTIVYYGETPDEQVTIDDESTAYGWFALEDLVNLRVADSQAIRLKDVVCYLDDGSRHMG